MVLEPAGRVSKVAMDARFAGTEVGRCVAASFGHIDVPSFAGKAFTVVWTFAVR
jgi:hypothetical protein